MPPTECLPWRRCRRRRHRRPRRPRPRRPRRSAAPFSVWRGRSSRPSGGSCSSPGRRARPPTTWAARDPSPPPLLPLLLPPLPPPPPPGPPFRLDPGGACSVNQSPLELSAMETRKAHVDQSVHIRTTRDSNRSRQGSAATRLAPPRSLPQ